MSREQKLLLQLLSGVADQNFDFAALCLLLKRRGFEERVRGDHFIFSHVAVREIINLQPVGKLAKAYQVKQVRSILLKYKLIGDAGHV